MNKVDWHIVKPPGFVERRVCKMSISKVSAEDKLKAVKAVLAHEESPMVSAKRLGGSLESSTVLGR